MLRVNRHPILHLHLVLTVMLLWLTACSSNLNLATETIVSTQPLTASPTFITPSPTLITDTPNATLRPTIDPLISDLPIQPYAKLYTAGYLTKQEQAKVYAVVIRRLAGPDDSFRGTLHKSFLYIQKTTDDWWGDHDMPMALPQAISWSVQYDVGVRMSDIPMTIKWVAGQNEVKFDDQHPHVSDGVIVYLGNFFIGDDQRLYIGGGVFYADGAAQGQTYVFEYGHGEWNLIGRTKIVWIS